MFFIPFPFFWFVSFFTLVVQPKFLEWMQENITNGFRTMSFQRFSRRIMKWCNNLIVVSCWMRVMMSYEWSSIHRMCRSTGSAFYLDWSIWSSLRWSSSSSKAWTLMSSCVVTHQILFLRKEKEREKEKNRKCVPGIPLSIMVVLGKSLI